ncbi:hypothetical protein DFJ67_2158 [Asanoa ferruginea]|uniref:Uncharacterized protein n=1 Tax=Asanoa ferruginea TaxID=53367 RepID=A0A3D9ZFI5_9ACTN|nr:hypothetical protein DFJ67_2158 [Asanoa ferruginea]
MRFLLIFVLESDLEAVSLISTDLLIQFLGRCVADVGGRRKRKIVLSSDFELALSVAHANLRKPLDSD